MKICFLFFISLTCFTPAFTQVGLADSLKKELSKTVSEPTKLELQNGIGEALYSYRPDSAFVIWKDVVVKADELKSKFKAPELDRVLRAKGNALNNIAIVYSDRGMLDIGLEYI